MTVSERSLDVWDSDYFLTQGRPKYTGHAWLCHWSPKHFKVSAELIAAEPRDAAAPLTNADAVRNRVALVKRGAVPLATKAVHAQRAGALALVVADDGGCGALDQYCVPGAERSRNEGWARLDLPRPWAGVRIPVVLILNTTAEAVLSSRNVTDGSGTRVWHGDFLRDEL